MMVEEWKQKKEYWTIEKKLAVADWVMGREGPMIFVQNQVCCRPVFRLICMLIVGQSFIRPGQFFIPVRPWNLEIHFG